MCTMVKDVFTMWSFVVVDQLIMSFLRWDVCHRMKYNAILFSFTVSATSSFHHHVSVCLHAPSAVLCAFFSFINVLI